MDVPRVVKQRREKCGGNQANRAVVMVLLRGEKRGLNFAAPGRLKNKKKARGEESAAISLGE